MAKQSREDPYANVRSENAHLESYVLFFNRTNRPVDLYWVDYQGKHIIYSTIDPNEAYDVGSFVTHPWIFRDSNTGDKLITLPNREYVYYPKENLPSGIARAVIISEPLLTLRDLSLRACLQIMEDDQQCGQHFTSTLPSTLQAELAEAVKSAADYRVESQDSFSE